MPSGKCSVLSAVVIASVLVLACVSAHAAPGKAILVARASEPMLFDDVRSSVGTDAAAKEWQARTLRTLGLGETLAGLGLVATGLAIVGDEALAGLAAIGFGGGALWLGYTDLSASRRFFYPDSILSEDGGRERFTGAGSPVPAVAMQMRF